MYRQEDSGPLLRERIGAEAHVTREDAGSQADRSAYTLQRLRDLLRTSRKLHRVGPIYTRLATADGNGSRAGAFV